MNVAFSATVLARALSRGGVDGIGVYTRELGARLARAPGVSLIPAGFGLMPPCGAIPGVERGLRLPAYEPSVLCAAVLNTTFPEGRLIDARPDLFHSTDHLVPRYRSVPVLATVMDAIPLSNPEWIRTRFASQKRWLWRRAVSWADHVLTISEFSKRAIVEHFGMPDDRVSVVPLGVDERFFERIDVSARAEVLERLRLPPRFFLFVGTLQPRKNLERALDAHALLPPRLRNALPFVVVGRPGWGCDRLVARLTGAAAEGELRWLHYLPDFEVRALLQSAAALVFPSLCEGFGLPVLEAFASGLPVVTSRATSLPEVAGDAALLVDPLDPAAIAEAMREVVDAPSLAGALADAGARRARACTWDACAAATLQVYRRLV